MNCSQCSVYKNVALNVPCDCRVCPAHNADNAKVRDSLSTALVTNFRGLKQTDSQTILQGINESLYNYSIEYIFMAYRIIT